MSAPRDLLIEQLVPDYRAWLRKVASGMLGVGHEAVDDLVQEGHIAMWRAVGSFDPDASPADYWLKRSATQRMLTVVSRHGAWTGRPGRYDGGHGGNQPEQPVMSVDGLSSKLGVPFDVEDILAAHAVDEAVWAYHEGDIAHALASLTDRERRYVLARFWQGMTGPETDALFSVHSANIWKTAKPKLRESLAHLLAV